MAVSFKDYVLISDALVEARLDIDMSEILELVKKKLELTKKKLGAKKATEKEIDAEVERLKKLDPKELDKIKKSSASRDFVARRKTAVAPRKTQPTVNHHAGVRDAESRFRNVDPSQMRAGQRRAAERSWMGEENLTEGLKDYRVEYTTKTGGTSRFARIKAQDVTAVREKFRRDFHGMKILTVTPAKSGVRKVEEDLEQLTEAAEAKVVVMKVGYDYISHSDREKQGTATLFWTCNTAEEAEALKAKLEAAQDSDDGLVAKSPEDMIYHWGQNSYNDFAGAHGDMLYIENVKLASKEPALGRKVYAFNPIDFVL